MIKNITLGIVTAGIIGAGALGLAGTAAAATQAPQGPGYSSPPAVKAHPAPQQAAGARNHTGAHHIAALNNQ